MTERRSGVSDRPYRIGVIGSGGSIDEATAAAARGVGAALAERGALVVCGGLGGVMAAAAEGAAAAGGNVLGILPGAAAGAAAPGVSIPLPTDLGEARNILVVRTSEAVIAIAGGWGTLSEAAFCLKLGVPLLGLRDTLPAALPIERVRDPEAAVRRALELAAERRTGPAPSAERSAGGVR